MEPGPDLEAERAHAGADRARGADGPGGAVEGGQEAVARGVDLAPAEPRELLAHQRVVRLEQVAPAPVAQLDHKNSLWEGVHRVPKTLETLDKPVIAMVNGLAVGAGMGMTVMCDVRFAAESARFSTGYVRVGLVPGDGDTYFLPRLVGPAKALELLWTADFIDAPDALRLGIVQRVVPDAELRDVTYAFARQVADGPQVPIRMIKRLVYQSLKLDLRTHLDLVSSHMAIVRQTADHKEGVAAFKDKRPPKFQGR